jgi:hypothetical protein
MEDKKGGRVHAEDGIQSRSEKPRFLRPTGFSGGTGFNQGAPARSPEILCCGSDKEDGAPVGGIFQIGLWQGIREQAPLVRFKPRENREALVF